MTFKQWSANMTDVEREQARAAIAYHHHMNPIILDWGTLDGAMWTEHYRRALCAIAMNLGAIATRYQCSAPSVYCTTRGANPGACARHAKQVTR